MKKIWFKLTLAVLPVLLLGGCISHIGVKKVQPGTNPNGLRVHLPAPFVVGRPSPAGSIEYKIEYLPDPDEEYAITAWSLMAKNKADITRTMSLLLAKADISQDTGAVAAKAIEQGASVATKAVEAYQTERKADADAKVQAAKNAQTALATATTELTTATKALETARVGKADADAEVKLATLKRDQAQAVLNAATTAADKAAAELALATAEKDLTTAEGKATLADKEFEQAGDAWKIAKAEVGKAKSGNLDRMGALDTPTVATQRVPGPVIYRIVESKDGGSIALKQVNFRLFSMNGRTLVDQGMQLKRQTWTTPTPAGGQ